MVTCFGKAAHADVMKEIDAAGLKRPTFKDTIDLIHTAQQTIERAESQIIIDLTKNYWLLTDTGILYVPEQGAYVQDHPTIDENGWPIMNEKDLAAKLNAGDKSVRFTNYNYQTGELVSKQLAKNSLIEALAGEEKADLVAELISKYSDATYLWAFDKTKEPVIRIASLGSSFGKSLDIDGYITGLGRLGYAFGIK